jgi:membrane-associated phospholipid phosphatase
MYIHAHHALDVTVGALFGAGTALAFNAILPIRQANMWHFLISMIGFIVWQLTCRKMKPALPSQYARDWECKGARDS